MKHATISQPDPANPQSLNRYAYVLNNPLKYTDPSGHILATAALQLTVGRNSVGAGPTGQTPLQSL